MTTISKSVLVDTSFFIALWDRRDNRHEEAKNKQEYLDRYRLVVPWPILYETLNTRMVRRPDWMAGFEKAARRFETIDDSRYRCDALRSVREAARQKRRPKDSAPSLADRILLAMIDDNARPFHGILTFNHRDFMKPCMSREIEYLCSYGGAAESKYDPAPAAPRRRRRRSRKKT